MIDSNGLELHYEDFAEDSLLPYWANRQTFIQPFLIMLLFVIPLIFTMSLSFTATYMHLAFVGGKNIKPGYVYMYVYE